MFSALRKLASNNKNESSEKIQTAGGLQTMSASLQKKFAKGVHYNMKIIIRGDRNVGKTCLFQRLQGQGFIEEYNPTQEIQVASIQWNYKATDDVVKVEVWDVVDKGKKKKPLEGLKLNTNTMALPEEPALDAEFLNVYKGTHGVILMFDITKQWTFDYVKKEIPNIPSTIPIMVLANHRDMGHHRCVTDEEVQFFIESLERSASDAQIRTGESSMRNGFGLKYLHKFFNLPFLALQRDTLLKQLETNGQETMLTNDELDVYLEADDSNYDRFLELLTQRRRQTADSLNAVATSNAMAAPSPQVPTSQPAQPPVAQVQTPKQEVKQISPILPVPASAPEPSTETKGNLSSVDDFVVEADNDLGFLNSVEESSVEPVNVPEQPYGHDSDSDVENNGNPMVMGFQDEIDDEDYRTGSRNPVPLDLSSSSDEEPQTVAILPPVSIVNNAVDDVDTGLDDWLNSGQTNQPQAAEILSSDPVLASSSSSDVTGTPKVKSSKKKEKKTSKRKSKKSKDSKHREDDDDADTVDVNTHGDYEEI